MELLIAFFVSAIAVAAAVEPLTATISGGPPLPPEPIVPHGTNVNSKTGETMLVTERFWLRDSVPWLPTSGELHFARLPAEQWGDELAKMKAGGMDTVQTCKRSSIFA